MSLWLGLLFVRTVGLLRFDVVGVSGWRVKMMMRMREWFVDRMVVIVVGSGRDDESVG